MAIDNERKIKIPKKLNQILNKQKTVNNKNKNIEGIK
jgi:hypothetical protein